MTSAAAVVISPLTMRHSRVMSSIERVREAYRSIQRRAQRRIRI